MNDNITEINTDSFWKLIQSAKETCGQDMDAMMDFLKDRLVSMGPEQAQNFHDILHAAIQERAQIVDRLRADGLIVF